MLLLLDFDLGLEFIDIYGLELTVLLRAFIIASLTVVFIVDRPGAVEAGMTAATHTSGEFPDAETSLAPFQVVIATAHLRTLLLILGLLLAGQRRDWENSIESTWELGRIDGLVGYDSSVARFDIINFKYLLLLLLVIVETLGQRRTLVPAVDLISPQFKRFKVLRSRHYPAGVRRDSTDRVHIGAKLLRLPGIPRIFPL